MRGNHIIVSNYNKFIFPCAGCAGDKNICGNIWNILLTLEVLNHIQQHWRQSLTVVVEDIQEQNFCTRLEKIAKIDSQFAE